MVRILRHRQTKGPVSARPHLNRRATPRLHSVNAWFRQLAPSTLFGMFRIGIIKAAVLLCSILAWTHFAIGRAHDHVFDITGTVDASDGTPVNDVEIVLELDKPIYDGVTPLKSQRLVTSKGAFIFRCLSHSPATNYRITIRKDGFEAQTLSGKVPPDAHLTIHLKKIAP
jgi:hypothetical protein